MAKLKYLFNKVLSMKSSSLESLKREVFSYPMVVDQLKKSKNKQQAKQKILEYLDEIRASYSSSSMKTFKKFLDNTLNKFYEDINFDAGKVDLLNLHKNHSVILVPNHQSHADYIAINYAVFKHYKFPLYVAGGDNLNIFPVGNLFKKSGCFFIRRSFSNNILYRTTLEAYLYVLLKEKKTIEFFFEGGRSRTGKLRPPRLGLYKMLLQAFMNLKNEQRKKHDNRQEKEHKLVFVPVSIVHEYVPEAKALANEISGGKKKKESASDVFGLLKLFSKKMGNINIRLGKPIFIEDIEENSLKEITRELAFSSYREVGANMIVTPSSLLAMILLEEPNAAMSWEDIVFKADQIINYCLKFDIPISLKLQKENLAIILGKTIDIFIGNKCIDILGKQEKSKLFYMIKPHARSEMLYMKNTILHHFLVPYIISLAWVRVFRGVITTTQDLKEFFLDERRQLKHEFYLPTVKQFLHKTYLILNDALDGDFKDFGSMLKLTQKDSYKIYSKVGLFSRSLSYITESYLISALALRGLLLDMPCENISQKIFIDKACEVFQEKLKLKRFISYSESLSIPLFKSALLYFTDVGIVKIENLKIILLNNDLLDKYISEFKSDLKDQKMIR